MPPPSEEPAPAKTPARQAPEEPWSAPVAAHGPLVLIVHGRSGGTIPTEWQHLAAELSERRQAPTLLQALTAEAPPTEAPFWRAAAQTGAIRVVPMLLLPGGHVRHDMPKLINEWQALTLRQGSERPILVKRHPFLGAWPSWQTLLASLLQAERRAGSHPLWLHHPLEGPLGQRYIGYLNRRLEVPGLAAPYSADPAMLPAPGDGSVWQPLTLASNRLTESLHQWQGGQRSQLRLLPPLLQQPPVRQYLIETLEALP